MLFYAILIKDHRAKIHQGSDREMLLHSWALLSQAQTQCLVLLKMPQRQGLASHKCYLEFKVAPLNNLRKLCSSDFQ